MTTPKPPFEFDPSWTQFILRWILRHWRLVSHLMKDDRLSIWYKLALGAGSFAILMFPDFPFVLDDALVITGLSWLWVKLLPKDIVESYSHVTGDEVREEAAPTDTEAAPANTDDEESETTHFTADATE